MLASEAQSIAREWVQENRTRFPGYAGAYLAGSVAWLGDDDSVSPNSDIDIMVVIEDDKVALKPGKFTSRAVLLEASIVPFGEIADPETAVDRYHIAASIARQHILDDPAGALAPRFGIIAAEFPRRNRVIARMDNAQQRVVSGLDNLPADAPFHQQVMSWLFLSTVTTHILLVAGLRNPTIRRRFVEVRHLLESYGESPQLDLLLSLIGCEAVTRSDAERYLAALEPVFDTTASVESSTSRWMSDISTDARRISIDGTRELIEFGYHRESMFWIVATFTRCLDVLAGADEMDCYQEADAPFRAMMADLEICSFADIRDCSRITLDLVPAIRDTADRILDRNPEVIR